MQQLDIEPIGTGPLEPEASTNLRAVYATLIESIADDARFEGWPENVEELKDLARLTDTDLVLVRSHHVQATTEEAAWDALLQDVRAKCEAHADRLAERQNALFYGSASPFTDRERAECAFGVRGLFR